MFFLIKCSACCCNSLYFVLEKYTGINKSHKHSILYNWSIIICHSLFYTLHFPHHNQDSDVETDKSTESYLEEVLL
jgi:hypothetical protein